MSCATNWKYFDFLKKVHFLVYGQVRAQPDLQGWTSLQQLQDQVLRE